MIRKLYLSILISLLLVSIFKEELDKGVEY